MGISGKSLFVAALAIGAFAGWPAQTQTTDMTFFATSVGGGDGANLGGLEGADAHCLNLAEAVGAGAKTWRAYLSTQGVGGGEAVNARDRIGTGPWHNAEGVEIAANVDALHTEGANNIQKSTALTEAGGIVNGRGDSPNQHDMLTGTQQDGMAGTGENQTCDDWTSNGAGTAIVGHTDLQGNTRGLNLWNYSHGSRGCSQSNLVGTGGAGLFYCFAIREG
ncbi:MAG: hypothetical protein HN423_02225 [Alphaproteobacteria bacterium]|nr:hypothetical protein [Alphaproteobacteria bacterium]